MGALARSRPDRALAEAGAPTCSIMSCAIPRRRPASPTARRHASMSALRSTCQHSSWGDVSNATPLFETASTPKPNSSVKAEVPPRSPPSTSDPGPTTEQQAAPNPGAHPLGTSCWMTPTIAPQRRGRHADRPRRRRAGPSCCWRCAPTGRPGRARLVETALAATNRPAPADAWRVQLRAGSRHDRRRQIQLVGRYAPGRPASTLPPPIFRWPRLASCRRRDARAWTPSPISWRRTVFARNRRPQGFRHPRQGVGRAIYRGDNVLLDKTSLALKKVEGRAAERPLRAC